MDQNEGQDLVSTDHQLLKQYVTVRDESAFAALVHRHQNFVRAVCQRILRDSHLADDAAQAVFFAMAVRADRLTDSSDSLEPWLQVVATNAARHLQRSRVRTQNREQRVAFRTEPAIRESRELFGDELSVLPAELRQVLELRFFEGRTQMEIALHLGVSQATVRRRLDDGLQLLRQRIDRHRSPLWGAFIGLGGGKLMQPSSFEGQISGPISTSTPREIIQRIEIMWRTVGPYRSVVAASCGVTALLATALWLPLPRSEAVEQTTKPPVSQKRSTATGSSSASTMQHSRQDSTTQKVAPGPKPAVVKLAENTADWEDAPASALAPVVPSPGELNAPRKNSQNVQMQKTQTQTNSAFSGSVNINGKEFRTTDPAEFQKFMQENRNLFPQLPNAAMNGAINGAKNGGQAEGGAFAGGNAGGMAHGNAGGIANGLNGGNQAAAAAGKAKGKANQAGKGNQGAAGIGNAQGGAAAAAGGGANGAFNGTININGQEVRTNDPAEFQRLMQQNQLPQFPQLQLPFGPNGGGFAGGNQGGAAGAGNGGGQAAAAAGGGTNGAFNGVLNINGEEFRTNDPAEFQRLLQQHQNVFPKLP